MKKVLLIFLLFLAAVSARAVAQEQSVEVRARAVVRFEFKAAQPLASVSALEGDVFLRRAGGVVWERLAQGQDLATGETIKTLSQASVELVFKDSSRMRLSSSTEVTVTEGLDAQGVQNSILSLNKGKLWADIQPAADTERTIIMAGPSIMDSRNGTTFLEITPDDNVCMDTFKGSINVRAADAPDDAVEVGPSKRVKINPQDNAVTQSQIKSQSQEAFADNYSCMEKAAGAGQLAAAASFVELKIGDEGAKEDIYVIHAYGTVSFASGTAAAANSAFVESPQGVAVFIPEDSVKETKTSAGGVKETPEYQDVLISTRVTMTIAKAEETAATSTVTTTTTTSAATTTTTTEATQPEVTTTTTTSPPTTATSQPEETSTTATTTATTQPEETVTTTTAEPVCDTLPVLAAVAVSGDSVASGGSKDIVSQSCGAVSYTISGQASSVCGTVSSVAVTGGGSLLSAQGKDQWSAVYSPKDTGTAKIEITVTDSKGNQSEPYTFDIAFSRDEPEPSVAVELIGGSDAAGAFSGLALNRTNLENGKLVISGSAVTAGEGCSLKTVEVSIDGGSSWKPAVGAAAWTYELTPSAGTYNVTARATDLLGKQSPDLNAVEVSYSPLTDEDMLRQIFETMLGAYKDRNSSGFMEYVSNQFSTNYDSVENSSNLNTSLDAKFSAYPSISLRHRIDAITVNGSEGRVAFSWDSDQNSTAYSHYGTFVFVKDSTWFLNTVDDNDTFLRYTKQAGSVTMSAGKLILTANETDSTTISIEARDSANNLLRDGSEVTFTTTSGTLSSMTAATLLGKASVTFTAGSTTGTTTISAATGGVTAYLDLTLKSEPAPLPPP